jgi:putative ABC transport system substrate-binding protein
VLLTASGLAAPAAMAQRATGLPRLAWVCPSFPVESLTLNGLALFRAFNEELAALGYVEGQTVTVERWSGLDYPDYGALVRAAVASRPDIIFACGWDPMARSLIDSTATIPIIFTGGNDPLANGFVTNLARPGGNVTGIALEAGIELTGKLLQLLTEAVPSIDRVAYLAPSVQWELIQTMLVGAGGERNVEIVPILIDAPYDVAAYEQAFAAIAEQALPAIVVGWSPENGRNSALIAQMALAAGLPSIQSWQEFVNDGGLISYTPDRALLYRRAAQYVVRVLQGQDPGELPIQQPESFVLSVNLRTAALLGVTIPISMLSIANFIVE